jgi:hypothetical protein
MAVMNKPSQKKRRSAYLKVMVTPEEKGRFFKLAAGRRTDLSEMIRQLLHAEAAKQESQSKGQAA